MKDCSKKRGLDARQVRRTVRDRSEWEVVRGNAWGMTGINGEDLEGV